MVDEKLLTFCGFFLLLPIVLGVLVRILSALHNKSNGSQTEAEEVINAYG